VPLRSGAKGRKRLPIAAEHPIQAFNHQHLDVALAGRQLEAELRLNGRQEIGTGRVAGRYSAIWLQARRGQFPPVFQVEIIRPSKLGAVHHRFLHLRHSQSANSGIDLRMNLMRTRPAVTFTNKPE
jgi:hypothetical protein